MIDEKRKREAQNNFKMYLEEGLLQKQTNDLAKDKYIDPDNGSAERFGVYTTVDTDDPSPPASIPSRPDVFMAGRQFPLPAIDFVGLTSDLSTIKTERV